VYRFVPVLYLFRMNNKPGVCAPALGVKTLIPGIPNIITESDKIGTMAAEHLLGLGFKQFAYCGFKGIFWSEERSESFSKRIAQAGFKTNIYQQPRSRTTPSWEEEKTIMAYWLRSLPKPTGLMACNDDRAQQVAEACKISGSQIPIDVAVIGVDDDKLVCELIDPPLTSIGLNFERAGYEAAELLDRLMAGEEFSNQKIIVQTMPITLRKSTGIMAMEDHIVAEAVSFIRKNASKQISVDDVSDELPVSRRDLERRFRREIGRSILSEIRSARTEAIIRMLFETNLSVSQIALHLGFSDASHISRFFRSMKGMSMLEYRRKFGSI
jgi:LacI family transcriptional regulator